MSDTSRGKVVKGYLGRKVTMKYAEIPTSDQQQASVRGIIEYGASQCQTTVGAKFISYDLCSSRDIFTNILGQTNPTKGLMITYLSLSLF